jgi:2-C-methyl-D-erythritol 4-phosphate cytidylyltransferase
MTQARLSRALLESALSEAAKAGEGRDTFIAVGGKVLGTIPQGGIVVTAEPVTEAVKVVAGDRLVGALDRDDLAELVLPLAIHGSTLRRILEETDADPIDLPREVAARGGRVIPAP